MREAGQGAPMAVCPEDGEPLVFTVIKPGHEWVCVPCGRFFTFFGAATAVPTEALSKRYEELRDQWSAAQQEGK